MTTASGTKQPTVWTRRLQILTAACAVVCTIGTTLWGALMLSGDVVEQSMRLAGMSAEEAKNTAEGMLPLFVLSGVVYVVGNALGVLALRGWNWVFWLAIVINLTQGMGVLGAVPPEIYQAVEQEYGTAAVLPSLVTDGVGLGLAAVLVISLVVFRAPWARRRSLRQPAAAQ